VGFEPTIPAFERAKTVDVSDRAATVISKHVTILEIISNNTVVHNLYEK
jgi:hypothetical protein